MAFLVSSYSFLILLFYSNIFSLTSPITVNDSWLWPNEIDIKIDERPFTIRPQKLFPSSSSANDMTMRRKVATVVYQDNPLLVNAAQHTRRNSSAWKKLKSVRNGKLPSSFTKTTNNNSGFGVSKNLDPGNRKTPPYFNATNNTPLSIRRDWTFPEDNVIRRKAELKCAEYYRDIENRDVWIHSLVGSWPAIPSPKKADQTKCKGIQNLLIIGGIVARADEFSHMAALGWRSPKNEASFLCGGSLISNQWVITAAHCTHGPLGPPIVVRVGARHLDDKSAGKLIRVHQIIRHPSYKPPAVYADLALLKLNKTVNFGALIKPACLYTEFDSTPMQAWATGWGVTGLGQDQSDELLKVRLDIVDNVDCALKLNRSVAIPRGIVPSMLCAGDIGGDWQSDTCQGDSGGPLQISHPKHKCLYQIIGVTSFGRLCAMKNSPGVYTRISHYLNWIESIVWPDNHQ